MTEPAHPPVVQAAVDSIASALELQPAARLWLAEQLREIYDAGYAVAAGTEIGSFENPDTGDWKLEIRRRLDEDKRQCWGEPEFREALGYIGHRLGLQGSFHLVNDVVPAFEQLLVTMPEHLPRILTQLQYAMEKVPRAEQSVILLASQLRKVEKLLREIIEEQE